MKEHRLLNLEILDFLVGTTYSLPVHRRITQQIFMGLLSA